MFIFGVGMNFVALICYDIVPNAWRELIRLGMRTVHCSLWYLSSFTWLVFTDWSKLVLSLCICVNQARYYGF